MRLSNTVENLKYKISNKSRTPIAGNSVPFSVDDCDKKVSRLVSYKDNFDIFGKIFLWKTRMPHHTRLISRFVRVRII